MMEKRLIIIVLAAAFLMCSAGCSNKQSVETGVPLEIWEAVRGSFVREDSSQYNNSVLSMMYLSNNCMMFEFRLMEGSEAKDTAHDTIIHGVLIVMDNGTGMVGKYETFPDAENPFSINFILSEDGQRISVTHSGNLDISPDGKYIFTDDYLEVSDLSANTIIDHLPTATTSLNANLGAYTVNYPDALVADWFYPVEAVFDDTGTTLAKFIIAKDMSAVFRVDDDIEPVLIFGSAQPMMDAEVYVYQEEPIDSVAPDEDDSFAEISFEFHPIVSVEIEDGVTIGVDSLSRLIVSLPWELPYTITTESSDNSVASVDENGIITAISAGETVISGTLIVEDGSKDFSIELSVTDELPEPEVLIN